MKEPRVPRTIVVDHLSVSKPRKAGLFRNIMIADYDSPEGVVREFHAVDGTGVPTYKLLKTGEPVKIESSATMSSDIDEYFEDMSGFPRT